MRKRAVGLMSGTSADGLSIVLCEIDLKRRKIMVKKYKTYNYLKSVSSKIMNARNMKLDQIVDLHYELGKLWTNMLDRFFKEENIDFKKIDVISSHGQTIYHSSQKKVTYQIGEVEFISRKFKIPVVYDLRVGDIVFGGEGAPIIPIFDEFLFGNREKPVCLLNIGGISNISVVGKNIRTYGFDVGPGNSLMDWAIRIYSNEKMTYDKDGKIAFKGKIDFRKVDRFMKSKFFYKKPPKSLDREEFGKDFVLKNFNFKKERIEDILATLNYFTAKSISFAIEKFVKEDIDEIIVNGGGVYNKTLIENIRKLTNIYISSIEKYSIHPLAKESAAMALIGVFRILSIPSNCPQVTGAKKKVVLGKISF